MDCVQSFCTDHFSYKNLTNFMFQVDKLRTAVVSDRDWIISMTHTERADLDWKLYGIEQECCESARNEVNLSFFHSVNSKYVL